jgi:hypothetical protein
MNYLGLYLRNSLRKGVAEQHKWKSSSDRSKGIQVDYDLPASGNLDASLRWGFADGRGLLNIFCSDIFQTSMISPVIDYGGQYVHTRYKGWRRAGVALTWKFGDYTEKRREAVDTGRFK